jgi:prepilin-type N-terminal cleavage/methylation domain-containing protein
MPDVIRSRHSDERGFTLIEMLVAASIGVILLMAAFMLLDRSFSSSATIADRQEGLQRGRQAMELITRQLRSQVCVVVPPDTGYKAPVVSATDDAVSFYGSLSESSTSVEKRTLTFVPDTATSDPDDGVSITQNVITGTPNTAYPQMAFSGSGTTTTLLTKVKRAKSGSTTLPVFRYYRYKPGAPVGDLEQLTAPVAAANLPSIALIKIAFRSYADRPISDDNDATQLEDDVYIRISDSSEAQETPQCI